MLKGKTIIVTGANRGIGKAIALKLGKIGANVIVNYRSNEKEASEVVAEIKELGGEASMVKADVSKYEDAENLISEAKNIYGSIYGVVNNAGITKDTLILRMKEEDFDAVINTNLKGTFNCCKAATPHLIKARQGRIVNISSVIGLIGNVGQINYAASKAGILGVTKSLAREIGARGITVNAIAPGFIESDMTEVLADKYKEDILKNIPLKKLGKAEDVANAVAFLMSEESQYITGQVLNVDGGMVM
ncbi:3-oxoacyl-[acyl-carrier-protein] reductase [Clostridium intestinale]|uniref:3-oxoacyl-[acyl-carrier-protein] reductase n=1 Tax=Clostridium intestinale DSM 6191 TaxID=1121320 RepID=A0A1M5SWC8_9CLOT|nr:3-oxoacyl-[acyl-carrier-protein] reductase [Clostridium intestinale]SHH42807.1 3-oxoacyl-[acyl-carrier-protein] reductase [Clostridium intestinale DSM 6191]